jgi:signal transduction histidine kinase
MKHLDNLISIKNSPFEDKILKYMSTRKPVDLAINTAFQVNLVTFLAALSCNFGMGVVDACYYVIIACLIISMNVFYQWYSITKKPDEANISILTQFGEDGAIFVLLIVNATANEMGNATAILWLILSVLFVQSAISIRPIRSFLLSKSVIFLLGLEYIYNINRTTFVIDGTVFPFTATMVLLSAFGYWLYIRQVRLLHLQFEQSDLRNMLAEKNRDLNLEAKLRKKMIRHIGHDLRQPINSLSYALYNIDLESLAKDQKQQLMNASCSVDVANYLIEEILNTSIYKNYESLTVNVEKFGVGELLETLNREYLVAAESNGCSLRVVVSSMLIESDTHIVARILRNFLSNSVRYAKGKKILLGVRRRYSHCEIQVIDNGPGISNDILDNICEEFVQGEQVGKSAGFGLGLSIAKHLAELIQGELRIASTVGCGTCCSLLLPNKLPSISSTTSVV